MLNSRVLALLIVAGAGVALAQPVPRGVNAPGPLGPPGAGGLASLLIDARRELNLTARQLVALDSIERSEFTQRRNAMQTMRARRDSVCANRTPCELTSAERQSLMGGPTTIERRIGTRLRADSAGRARIMGMLDSTQRRLADRLETRRGGFARAERGVSGPPRRQLRRERMRDVRPDDRRFRAPVDRRGWRGDDPMDRQPRMRRPDRWRGDDEMDLRPDAEQWMDPTDGPPGDRRMGPADRAVDRVGPAPRRRPRIDGATPPDTTEL